MKTKEVRELLREHGAFIGMETLGREARCRGMSDDCPFNMKSMPKGTVAFRISIYTGTGGDQTAYYCETCRHPIIERLPEISR